MATKQNISIGVDYSIIAQYNHNKNNINCRLSTEDLQYVISEQFSRKRTMIIFVVYVILLFVLD